MRRGTLITGAVVGVLVVGSAVGATAAVVSLQKAQAETDQVGSAQLQAVSGVAGETSQASRAAKPLVAPKLKVPAKKPPVVIARPVPVPAAGGGGGQGAVAASPDSWVSSDGQSGNAAPVDGQSDGGTSAGNSGGGSGGGSRGEDQGEVEDSSNSYEEGEQEQPEAPEPAEAPESESGDDD